MFAGPPTAIAITPGTIDAALETVPNCPAVFAIWPAEGAPYLARTTMLARRLKRLLRSRETPSKLLNLRDLAIRVDYWPVVAQIESALTLYELARSYMPGRYLRFLKLRMPHYVKLILSNAFPRVQVTTRLSASRGLYYGPFHTRAAAEQFEHSCLDLFQLRRCQEDLQPSPEHPGCIYGEMGMCLRPCQQVVGASEYASEVARVSEFLTGAGKHMLRTAEEARDRLSQEMQFEEAARQHKRVERIQQVLDERDGLAADVDRLCGVTVSAEPDGDGVKLWFLIRGVWQPPLPFALASNENLSMDRRLRDLVCALPQEPPPFERQEHLALLSRWYHSTWRQGDWLQFASPDDIPYRRLVGAISRAAARTKRL